MPLFQYVIGKSNPTVERLKTLYAKGVKVALKRFFNPSLIG